MPVKPLPAHPRLAQLKAEARDLLKACAAGDPPACQRLRQFHPRFADARDSDIASAPLTWSDGLFAVARERGFASWPRLKAFVDAERPNDRERPHHERITDTVFRRAVELIDDGDIDALAAHLDAHPDLVRRRVTFEGENYFGQPSLLAFIAENPIRNDALPPNIVDVAGMLLHKGAGATPSDVTETLALVSSGRVAREAGAQRDLIRLLCKAGADPGAAIQPALAHGEFDAADALLQCGARRTLPVAAALGQTDEATALLQTADPAERHLALAYAAQHGHAPIVRRLLDAGVDPDRYNPPGAHSHSTPLHQAAWNGHADVVRALVEHGARRDLKDTLWNATAREWAVHGARHSIAEYLGQFDSGE